MQVYNESKRDQNFCDKIIIRWADIVKFSFEKCYYGRKSLKLCGRLCGTEGCIQGGDKMRGEKEKAEHRKQRFACIVEKGRKSLFKGE